MQDLHDKFSCEENILTSGLEMYMNHSLLETQCRGVSRLMKCPQHVEEVASVRDSDATITLQNSFILVISCQTKRVEMSNDRETR